MALVVFALWALFVTTAPAEQFQEDPKFAKQYKEYYQGLTAFGSALIVGGGVLYYLHRRSLRQRERESQK
ncbi:MAG: hypothetical protein QXU32_09270 [Nitrososphaerales archaeon]